MQYVMYKKKPFAVTKVLVQCHRKLSQRKHLLKDLIKLITNTVLSFQKIFSSNAENSYSPLISQVRKEIFTLQSAHVATVSEKWKFLLLTFQFSLPL